MKIEEFSEYCDSLINVITDSAPMEVSLQIETNDLLSKQMALSAASHFEYELCKRIEDFAHMSSSGNEQLKSFLRNKAISRQFHTWFNWNEKNANQFFGYFGQNFKEHMKDRVKNEDYLNESIQAFLELGSDRNKIIHGDYLNCTYDKTICEVFSLFKSAKHFVELFPEILLEFNK